MRSAPDDRTAVARIRDAAIEQWGEHGFNVGLRSIAEAAGVSAALVIHHVGSKDGLRKACDDYIAEEIRTGKSASLQTKDPADWFAQMAEIESYAPLMAYLVRSMQSGTELAKMLWQRMIDNAEEYLEEGVRNGLLKPSRDARRRARDLGKRVIDNAEEYREEGGRRGWLNPTRAPRARARYLGMSSGGGFLMYLQ